MKPLKTVLCQVPLITPSLFLLAYSSSHTILFTRVLTGGEQRIRLEGEKKKKFWVGRNKNAIKMCKLVSTQST